MTEADLKLLASKFTQDRDISLLALRWKVLQRRYEFKVMVCNEVSQNRVQKKKLTVAACKKARKLLEKLEEKILATKTSLEQSEL